jgi:hypothetical protein
MLDTVISTFIEKQFPSIYRQEGPFFVEFMKQYYVWLETDPSSPVYNSRIHSSIHDIDTTVDEFVVYFKEKYLKGIQLNTATNTKQLVKNSIDLYRSKGTENAIRLFFDLIFSSPAEVYYPGLDVFRLSDAQWVIPSYIEVTSKPVNRLLVGRSVVGTNSGATAFVEKLVRRRVKNTYIEVLYVSAITGEFETGEIIKLDNSTVPISEFPTMIGSLNEAAVSNGSDGFELGEVVNISSRTGIQGRAIVSELNSIGGIVEFDLLDGGWGYTSNTIINVSENVLQLANVQLTTTTNATMADKMTVISQPMANVQWYANTADFGVGDVVYNYYANGSLIGSSVIISAEYGTSNTTNYFLLNTISGNTAIDYTNSQYFNQANTQSFTVQPAGHVNVTATANVTGLSSNVTINCVGNSATFSADDVVYQVSSNNVIFSRASVIEVTPVSSQNFELKVDNLNGMFLTNFPLLKTGSNTTANISSLKLDAGVINTNNSFKVLTGNIIKFVANVSTSTATITNIPFGSGANVSFDDDLVNTENVMLNPNYVRDHIDELNSANWVNSASYGASLNNANLNSPVLGEALRFDAYTLGTIARLQLANPGSGYSYPPIVQAIEPLVAPLYKQDFVIRIESATGIFRLGERVVQAQEGARGLVKFANTSEVHVRRLNYEDKWQVGNANVSFAIIGESSGFSAYPTEVTYDIDGVAGLNAVIDTDVISSNSAVKSLKITDSGFGFLDNSRLTFSSLDNLRAGTATSRVKTLGRGSGFYISTSGFLSDGKYLHDGEYYQDFSYEIRSPITADRYVDMLKNVLHVSGTRYFSSILSVRHVDSTTDCVSSTVSITSNP